MPGPHDLFVRYTFGQPERAAAELRAVLPPRVVSQVDWSTLQPESGSVVDPELRETESDLLFSARLRGGRPLLFYVLMEHQSSVDGWMALRMLRYVVRQLEHWRKANPESKKLPVVVPLVMYHGPDGTWTAPRRVEELFEMPDEAEEKEVWRALVPRFEYLLDDLTAERADALMARPGPPLARLAWLALRYGRTEELANRLPTWTALFAQVHAAPDGTENLKVVIRYLFLVGDKTTRQTAGQVLHSVMDARQAEDLMRSYGEQLIERGRRKGLKQGLALGRAEGLLRILVARGLLVDEQARQRVLTCMDLATLNKWLDRAVTATTLSEVWGDPVQ
ncbi:Rpn family recombination-promoting nuclease/putative transposase [Archangium sp. Cb G35]|uniref:Rpn family recombination-promoting nuclease/putative transposase n=1 Tax=Archangium sp. Cb G35 TaxID=1920190 RepID=UPI0009365C56|nr:Rpn family recombination-promoting nuclease/putative transposase [Archangium sp. Cb G35]